MAKKTYYKYQPHAAETQINWAEISGNFSNILQEETRVREEKKAAINKASREFQSTLNTVEQGESATANQWWLEGASQIQEQMLMQDRLLKSGTLRPKDYTIMRQNLTDGTDGLIGVFGAYNTELSERLARAEADESQDLEGFLMETMENFGNFQDTAIVINGETANMSVADIKDGIVQDDPNKIRSINSLKGLLAQRYDKYDLDAATTGFVDGVGTWDTFERTYGNEAYKGMITRMSDPFFKGFNQAELMELGLTEAQAALAEAELNVYAAGEQNFVSDVMSNWGHVSSILTNTINRDKDNEAYTFTFGSVDEQGNPIERAPNEILLVQNPHGIVSAEYTPEQEEAVAKAIRDDVRNKLDREITQVTAVPDYTQPSAASITAGSGKESQKDLVGLWSELYYKPLEGKDSTIEAILSSDRAVESGLMGVKIDGKTIEFEYEDSQYNRIEQMQPNMSKGDWINLGAEIHGIADIDESTTAAGRWPKDYEYIDFTTTATDPETGEVTTVSRPVQASRQGITPPVDTVAKVASQINSAIKDDWFFNQDDAAVLDNINGIVSTLGFTVTNPSNFSNTLTITNPETEATITVSTNEDSKGSKQQAENLKKWVNAQLTNANAAAYSRVNKGTTSGSASQYDKANQ